MTQSVYKSCNCFACRKWTPSTVKKAHKKAARKNLDNCQKS